jgi:hypothetical protein
MAGKIVAARILEFLGMCFTPLLFGVPGTLPFPPKERGFFSLFFAAIS